MVRLPVSSPRARKRRTRAGSSIAGALFVVTRRNLIAAVMGMVGSFIGIAAIYMLLYAHFIAVIQMLVYAGAIDERDEALVRGLDGGGVAALHGLDQAAEGGLDRRAVADVLHALALGDQDALLLLLDVGHEPFSRVSAGTAPQRGGG